MGLPVSPSPSPLGTGFAELLRGARAGSAAALGRLLEQFRPYLLQIANEELPDPMQAKVGASDIVQDTFLAVQRFLVRFHGDSPGEFQAWLRHVLRFKLAAQTRRFLGTDKRRAHREVQLDALADPPEWLLAPGSPPSSIAHRAEESVRLRQAIERLPEQYRQVVRWRQWDELSFDEIARRLDRSLDAARMVWWRAIKKLMDDLKQSDVTDGG